MSPSLNTKRLSTNNGITNGSNNSNNNNNNSAVHSRLHASGTPANETNEMQRRKCENLISYFTTQIHHLNKELEIEKRSRDTHLAKIVKALLCFEAKLKSDQKQIRQQLFEKDTQLNRMANEVKILREKYGVKDDEALNIDAVSQYCPCCRKQYYLLSTSDVGVQFNKHELMCHDGLDKGKQKRVFYFLF